jgi:two-component system, NtrC family, response regulator HydG
MLRDGVFGPESPERPARDSDRGVSTILVIDDDETLREGVSEACKRLGHEVMTAESGDKGVELFDRTHDKQPIDLVITDLKMDGLDGIGVLKAVKQRASDTEVIVMTAYGTIETAVEAMRQGAFNFITKEKFRRENVQAQVSRAIERRQLKDENARLVATTQVLSRPPESKIAPDGSFMGMLGFSSAMRDIFQKIEKIGKSETNVHISGESGTGKELVAQAIHDLSRRAAGPLIKVNCGAIPETLLESELFGHEKGAFTGAIKRKLGRFELAHGGTIFLDEIGELSSGMQVKLLRVLQEKELERVGGEKPVKVDVRVLSATNRDLKREVEEGRFREDLFYRLHIVPIHLPPLRERTDDIIPLARHFVQKLRKRTNPDISSLAAETESHLLHYHYPGNVRELENIIEQALVFATPPTITVEDLPQQVSGAKPTPKGTRQRRGNIGLDAYLEMIEREEILEAYEAAGGVKTETARRLDIKTSALYYKLEKYGIGTVAGRDLSSETPPAGGSTPGEGA